MKLYVDSTRGALPAPLARTYADKTDEFPFHQVPAGSERCGRCNREVREHWWQIVDPDVDEQGGVIDCEVTA